jgi:hypothetical protein
MVVNRMRVLHRSEVKRQRRVIALGHHRETRGLLGPPLRHIDVNESADVLRAIKLTDPSCPIDVFVHTAGDLLRPTRQRSPSERKRVTSWPRRMWRRCWSTRLWPEA